MNSVLHQLWNGEIDPYPQIRPSGKEYEEIDQKISDEYDWWHNKLPREEYFRLEAFHDMLHASRDFHSEESFKYGFRLAFMIFLDSLTN